MRVFWTAAILAMTAPACAAGPANTIAAMFVELNHCMEDVRVVAGTDVTVQFSLNRWGAVIGRPRITHAHWVGDDGERKTSAAAIATGFDRCLPLKITDALGGAIAGHMIAYRFRAGERGEQKT